MNIIRLFHEYKLKTQLKFIFDQAEKLDEQGIEHGIAYSALYADAMAVVGPFKRKYPDYDTSAKIAALDHLREMTATPERKKSRTATLVAMGLLACTSVLMVSGLVSAAFMSSYYFWLHLFRHLGLG